MNNSSLLIGLICSLLVSSPSVNAESPTTIIEKFRCPGKVDYETLTGLDGLGPTNYFVRAQVIPFAGRVGNAGYYGRFLVTKAGFRSFKLSYQIKTTPVEPTFNAASVRFEFDEKVVTQPFSKMTKSSDEKGNTYVEVSAQTLGVSQNAKLLKFYPFIATNQNTTIYFGDYYVDRADGPDKGVPVLKINAADCPVLPPS